MISTMTRRCRCFRFSVFAFLAILASHGSAVTDISDVEALQDLYRSLNTPPQLRGWKAVGGDPCEESWDGVLCAGSSVIQIKLDNLNLSGYLGFQLSILHNLKQLDVSNNHIYGVIPYSLPLNLTHLNLACNNLTQSIPYSLTSLTNLRYMNLSHNYLSGPIGNVFTGLSYLTEMDLSYNQFIGDLPSSFGTLRNLSKLFLQHNEFTGSVNFLANLQLSDLNIQDNHFSGIIPKQLQTIHNSWLGGNTFDKGENNPTWENLPDEENVIGAPSTTQSSAIETYHSPESVNHKKKGIGPGKLALMVGGGTLVATCAALFFVIRLQNHARMLRTSESSEGSGRSLPISFSKECSTSASEETPEVLAISSPLIDPRNLPLIRTKVLRVNRRSFANKSRMAIGARLYTMAEIRLATNNFNKTNFLGEGSLGSVFRAEFADGQVFAVKSINTVVLSLHEEQQFLEVLSNASRLKHPNVVQLHGYCVEQEHHILVYEYVRNLTLDHAMHSEAYTPFSWGLRLQIALGIAQALNYLHSTCVPPVPHRNLKAANVLLDKELTPHVSDCGLAVLKPLSSNSVKLKASEMAICDTGYIAPEHIQAGTDYQKADVYAFGVLLLELLTRRKPFDGVKPGEQHSLVQWVCARLHDIESLDQMVDPTIRKTITPKALSRFADIVSLCTWPGKGSKAVMPDIVESLTHMLQDHCTSADPFGTDSRSFGSTAVSYLST